MILVVGSTGMVGSEICQILSEKGQPFRALVREPSDSAKVQRIQSLGGTPVLGDLRRPETLKVACEDVDTLLCTVSSMPCSYQPGVNDIQTTDTQGMLHLIDAARTACVKRFIDITFSGHIKRDFPLYNAKRAVETCLKQSGLIYTILRPGYFMEVWLSAAVGFDPGHARATLYGTGDQKISWISYKDVARYAVECVTRRDAFYQVLELGGPELLSPHEVIRKFEQAAGRKFDVAHVPPEALEVQFAGASDGMQKSFIGLMLCYADGDPTPVGDLQRSFAVPQTHLSDFIHAAVPG